MQGQQRHDSSALSALQGELEETLDARAAEVPGALRNVLKLALQETFTDLLQDGAAPRDLLHAFVHELVFEILLYADDFDAEALAEELCALIDACLARAAAAA